MKYDLELDKTIKDCVDEKYAKFHGSLVPNAKILGVRVPFLRKIAKKFSVHNDFLQEIQLNYYEKTAVACYYVGLKAKTKEDLQKYLSVVLPKVDNWALCDGLASSLKVLKKDKENELLPYIFEFLSSDKVYDKRFAIVCLLHYLTSESLVKTIIQKVTVYQGTDYYVDMAIAWLLATACINFESQVKQTLENGFLTTFVQNKTISKINESFRISTQTKEKLKLLLKK